MSGIAIISKTEYDTVMIRLVHHGKIVDRIEVEQFFEVPEEDVENKVLELRKKSKGEVNG